VWSAKNTGYVVAGEKAGSKLTKVQEPGVGIMDEERLITLLVEVTIVTFIWK